MIQIYCEKQKHHKTSELCTDCKKLLEYILLHLEKCPFQEKKTACGRCELQCYPPNEREEITGIMSFAGRWMFIDHPILTLHHIWDARRKPPQIKT